MCLKKSEESRLTLSQKKIMYPEFVAFLNKLPFGVNSQDPVDTWIYQNNFPIL